MIIIGDFNTNLLANDRTVRQKNSKRVNKQNLTDMYKNTPTSNRKIQIFFKYPWNIHQDRLYPESFFKNSTNSKEFKSYILCSLDITE